MNKLLIAILLPILLSLLLLGGCARQQHRLVSVEDFEALDQPYDDGSGVMLKWKPLDRSHRIIQYNVYRGYRPDSLFLLGNIEVDPKMGVMGDYLYFYDKDFLPLIEFETAPASLKKEKDQPADSPVYRSLPADPGLLGSLLPHYQVMGEIRGQKFYKGSRKIKQGEDIFAGYRLTQFNNIFANPIPDSTYYYCVIAVNETGTRLPATKVEAATPRDNRPDSTATFYSAYLKDTNELSFEWSPPTGSTDIATWQGWLMPKALLGLYREQQNRTAQAPDSIFYGDWRSASLQVFDYSPPYWAPNFYHRVSLSDAGIVLPDNLQDYLPVFTFYDYSGFTTATLGRPLKERTSSGIPILPSFSVGDKKNDKGDNLLISLGRPIAYVTQASYTGKGKNRLRINYDIAKNENHTVDRIRFRFQDQQGKPIQEVMEYFPNQMITLRLPAPYHEARSFRVRIDLRLTGEKDFSPDAVEQEISFDESTRGFRGRDIFLNGQDLSRTYYDVFTRNRLNPTYSPGMRVGALSRSVDHTVPFEDVLYKSIASYDPASRRLLLDHHFTVSVDSTSGLDFSPSLYLDEYRKELADLERDQDPDQKRLLDYIRTTPVFSQAKTITADGAWRKLLRLTLDLNSRSYAYQLLSTDGKGMWSLSAALRNEKGDIWTYPVGDWFDTTKLATLIATLVMCVMVVYAIYITRRKEVYIRPIAGLQELDNAVGRATEMGRPVMFVPGWGTLGDPCTISAMMILNQIAKKTAEYDIRLISPHVDYFVVPLAQEMVQTAYSEMGRPDAYNQNDIFFVSDQQFAFSAAVNGITIRDRVATVFYMGYFNAEALLMTETGNQTGAIQIAATDAITQVPFFITTCDYTLIGEEFYAASAYLSREHGLVSMLKAQDYFKLLIVVVVSIGTVLSSLHIFGLLNFLPFE
jgi:hypothetical protein